MDSYITHPKVHGDDDSISLQYFNNKKFQAPHTYNIVPLAHTVKPILRDNSRDRKK